MAGDKKFFRFLRGELNGYYLNAVSYFINFWMDKNILPFLTYAKNVQMEIDSENVNENITTEDLINIAKFAGITQLLTFSNLYNNIIYMTQSHKEGGVEHAESGLYEKAIEAFRFYPGLAEEINQLANEARQSTLIQDGAEILGYIPEGTELYDRDGNFHPELILSSPPVDKAYTNYYGQKYLQLEENYSVVVTVPKELIYKSFLIIQRLRYNGSSILTFIELTELIVGEFIKINNVAGREAHVIAYYSEQQDAETQYKTIKKALWEGLVEKFFPQIALSETLR